MPLGRAARNRPATAAIVAVAATGALSVALLPAGPAAGVPAFNLDERAAAIASPAVVYLEARVDGYLRLKSTGALLDANPVTVTRQCSGFVAGTDGYVVTTGHCVQPSLESLRGTAAYLVADDLSKNHKLTAAQRPGFITDAMTTTDFVGAGGAAPNISVFGQLFKATGGTTSAPAITGKVVSAQTVAKGDVALVKLAMGGLPVALLATAPPSSDSHVVQIAFRTDDDNEATAAFTVRSGPASILGPYSGKTPPMYRLDSDLGDFAHGGMVVDGSGHVVGMINADTAKDKVNHLMSDLATIHQVLDDAHVKNEPAASDRSYAAGLDAYFAGRYTEAIGKFDAVLAAMPADRVAQNYRDQAQVRLRIEGDSSGGGFPRVTLALAALGGLLLIIGSVATALVLRRRGRRRREERGRLHPDPFARDSSAPEPFGAQPFGAQPFGAEPFGAEPFGAKHAGPFPPTFAAPISGAPISGAPISGAPISGAPVSGPPVSAPPISVPPVTPAPMSFVDHDAYPTVQVPDLPTDQAPQPEVPRPEVPQPEAPNWAGVPVPVSAPPGIPVQHPLWTARAPVRLPELFGPQAEPAATEPAGAEPAGAEPTASQTAHGAPASAESTQPAPPTGEPAGPENGAAPWPGQQSAWTAPSIPVSPWAATAPNWSQPAEQPPAPEQPSAPERPAGAD